MSPFIFAYYCSGHGFGHATRVSAFATHLLHLPNAPIIHIVSSAPKQVFTQCIEAGALYRNADIDPVIVQPIAYHVDRRTSVEVLKSFISQEDKKVAQEASWLKQNNVNCVLSDAAYLACKAASTAALPSVLVTNFTFDSVYSYLSVVFSAPSEPLLSPDKMVHDPWGDCPIPPEELNPLVEKLHSGYRCAQLLLLLPGSIPIPSFGESPPLPSYLWTDDNGFLPYIESILSRNAGNIPLLPPVADGRRNRTRKVVQSPLIVRHPSSNIYSPSGRKRLLDYVGVPEQLQCPNYKVLVVSFGGQVFRKPTSKASSRRSSQSATPLETSVLQRASLGTELSKVNSSSCFQFNSCTLPTVPIATASHLWIPGAPPASKTHTSPSLPASETFKAETNISRSILDEGDSIFTLTPSTPEMGFVEELTARSCSSSTAGSGSETDSDTVIGDEDMGEGHFLPDSSWIAIVCGASGATKHSGTESADNDLPENFFIAPKDVYMPDLTAIGDVLLGKLGYGTVSECIDACTPFVYVPRPLFIEEHGLRRLLTSSGVGVQLSREQYEAGDWAQCIQEAWDKGKEAKARKRQVGDTGDRRREGEQMAADLLRWVEEWRND